MVGLEEKDQQSTSSSAEQKFQYNAKEKLDEFGLFWNDHGARNLDLQTGRQALTRWQRNLRSSRLIVGLIIIQQEKATRVDGSQLI